MNIRNALAIALGAALLSACSTTDPQPPGGGRHLADGPRGQFECADRNSNDYIDRAELVYLHQCGVGEDLRCGPVPANVEAQAPRADFEGGRRMLEVIDADGDQRISKLEFRAHCTSQQAR
ncbi:EF-hand domain-containing protein [Marinobacter sp. JSM 1782161]|uniref:EF-hand domain-containing protein n=1 Tax=Marinobacter sp. JSM 1782161 TaxID=2685906 RepID=UPI001403C4D8|nr:EF-hand domain-containing protein [Marinobacter sp. JSM 1782161]